MTVAGSKHLPDQSLLAYSALAASLAAAGIPIYIHLPGYLANSYGISVGSIGALLLFLRAIDVVQDPFLGWLASRSFIRTPVLAWIGALALAAGMLGLFAWPSPIRPIVWVGFWLVVTFTAYSLLGILFYAEGVERGGQTGHVRVAAWREAGAFGGIIFACILPFALAENGYSLFAIAFAASLMLSMFYFSGGWQPVEKTKISLFSMLSDPLMRKFLFLVFLNAAPVAVTSTLFLFFVETKLGLYDKTGVFLVVFFASAAVSTPVWTYVAKVAGAKNALASGMLLAIFAFVWATQIGQGDGTAFLMICAASGAALGADMVLLPALFSAFVERGGKDRAVAFGLWNFCGKATLAISAGTVLPLLTFAGFEPGIPNSANAVWLLGVLYAVLPCFLKLAALTFLIFGLNRELTT